MATYVQLEKSLFGSKPIELYRFTIGSPAEPDVIGDFDDDMVVETIFADLDEMTGYGWDVLVQECDPPPEGGTLRGLPFIGPGSEGVLGTIVTCVQVEPFVPATAVLQLDAVFPEGALVWASFDYTADGHWFEPLSFKIWCGSSHADAGVNPGIGEEPATGTRVTSKITVDGTGIVWIQFKLNPGYDRIAHTDSYEIRNLHIYTQTTGGGDGGGGSGGPGTEVAYGFTSYKNEIEFNDELYDPLEINRGEIDTGGEDKPGALSVTLPSDSEIGSLLRQGLSFALMNLQIIRLQQEALSEPAIIFDGQVTSFEDINDVMTLTCAPLTAQLQDVVPQELVQKDQCPWHTGDPFTCKVDLAKFTFTGTVSAISSNGLEVTVDGAEDFVPDLPGATALPDMFKLGSIRKGLYQGPIEAQDGDVLTLAEGLPTLEVGDDVELVAGDDRTKTTCLNKFQNIENYGAFSELPAVNPAFGQNLRP